MFYYSICQVNQVGYYGIVIEGTYYGIVVGATYCSIVVVGLTYYGIVVGGTVDGGTNCYVGERISCYVGNPYYVGIVPCYV